MDPTKIEELEPPMLERTVRDIINWGLKHVFEGKAIIAHAQMLHIFLKHESLINVVELLGIKSEKEILVNQMV